MSDDDDPNSRRAVRLLTAAAASLAAFLLSALPAAAQVVDLGLDYGASFGLPDTDIRRIVTSLIRTLLGFVGLFMVLWLIWSGFLYMTHGGSEEAYEEAVASIKNAVIGLFIMLVSYSAANFIINAIANATGIM